MDLFGKKQQVANIDRLEKNIAAIAAQLNSVQMIAFEAVKVMGQEDRAKVMAGLRKIVVNFGTLDSPRYVAGRLTQEYRDEFSRVMQLFIEMLGKR